ncbi:MAG: hypothetical protein UIM53_02820 [Acutalibacteraceae bacterium]|nr:hypothetical protein [Acutalibacteraceae bacterium]
MRCNTPVSTEYAVEVNKQSIDGRYHEFVRRLSDDFQTYEEAEKFVENYNEPLGENEYLNIIFIDYDENGDEIGFGSVV